jgi:rhodanese-related sulfurtransferase
LEDQMKRGSYLLVIMFVLVSMILGACASAAATTEAPGVIEAPAEPTEAAPEPPAEEPAQEPEPVETEEPEPARASEEDLDTAFSAMLASMEKYNTTKMDAVMEAMAEDVPPFLLDVRQPEELEEKGHIEGAVNIPLRELGKNLDKLPSFDTPIVAYCGSGWRATIAMTALSAMGWEDVKALKNTYQEWVDAGNPVVEGPAEGAPTLNAAEPAPGLVVAFDEMLSNIPEGWGVIKAEDLNLAMGENPDMKLIDGRRQEEVDENGSIDSGDIEQTHIALEEFIDKKDMWPAVEDVVSTYCGSGHRSTMAMTMLWTYGYPEVTSLKDGYGGWKESGFATVGGEVDVEIKLDAGYENMLATMEKYNTTNMDAVNEALAEDQPPFLLDVRTTGELEEKGHITGAYHIPLQELGQNLDKLPSFDTPIVAYCGSGWRATIAMTALSAMGWEDVKAMKNTFQDWVDTGYAVSEGVPEEAPALNAAQPDSDLAAVFDAVLTNVPEGYGVMKAEDLNLLLAESPDMKLIDVRTLGELEEKGIIDSAEVEQIHVALEEFIAKKDQWPQDPASEIVAYCGSGHRSTMAMTMLWSYLYENVKSLKDGFSGWAEAGLPVVEYETVQ